MMNLDKLILTTTLLSTLGFHVNAQLESYNFYSYKMDNMVSINPAYVGNEDGVNILLNAQSQTSGVSYAQKNTMATVYSKISSKQALGIKVISDTRGVFNSFKTDLSYAYLLNINADQKLNFGVNLGVLSNSLQTSRINNFQLVDQSDETLYAQQYNNLYFTAGAGLLYTLKRLEVSVAFPHISRSFNRLSLFSNTAIFYTFDVNENFQIKPWLSYQSVPITKSVASLYAKVLYKEKIWGQIGYQSNMAVAAMIGFNVEQLSFGYGFTFSNSLFSDVAKGRHEISIKYTLNAKKAAEERAIKNSLNSVLKDLASLNKMVVTESNRKEIMNTLAKIKVALLKADLTNNDPKKAKKVEKQLIEIDEQLQIIEQKLIE